MNIEDTNQAALDARLRKLLGGLDAGAGFEERVMRRVAEIAACGPSEDLRAQFERRRELIRIKLRREAWTNTATALGLGACAGALSWRYASDIQSFAIQSVQSIDPNLLTGSTLAAIAVVLWFVISRARG